MLLSDVAVGAKVQIIVGIGMQQLDFSTEIAEVFDGMLYGEPIYQNDKMLGFGTKGLVLSLIVTDEENGRAWQFVNVKIRNIKTAEDKFYHEITCKTEARAINRRNAHRVWVGEPGVAIVGLGGTQIDVTVKDVSTSGIAFVCSSDEEITDGSVVHLTFRDPDINTRFELSAIVVRSLEIERTRTVYGCKLNMESSAIAKYVNEKQRLKLKSARQGISASVLTEKNRGRDGR